MDNIRALNEIINSSKYLVFLGGAGLSTESGIPDFRGKYGLYNKNDEIPAEMILSRTFFDRNKEIFYDFYLKNLVFENVLPNITHNKLVQLENKGILKAIITQNIYGLHEKAGSKNVYNLHGSIYQNHCMLCKRFYRLDEIDKSGIPRCSCGGIIKPDVTLYEEELNQDILEKAVENIKQADALIVAGNSLTVYPAAGLINYFKGKNLIIINKDIIPVNRPALVINEYLGYIFNKIKL